MSLDDDIPTVNWPQESGERKLVQLLLDGRPIIRFAEESHETHGIILMKLFMGLDIEYEEIEGKDGFGSIKGSIVPAPEGERYKMVGAGTANVNLEQRHASMSGNSLSYGIGIDSDHLDTIKPLQPEWNIE